MIVLGLTGSIAMGKSTTAAMFREFGIPVHDADAVVHSLYERKAVSAIRSLFPDAVIDGKVDRERLGRIVLGDRDALKRLEAVIHPMVAEAEREFLSRAEAAGEELVVLDIPLLFETGAQERVDGVIVVTASAQEQRRRVMARPGMTEEKFRAILERQVPDEEKRRRADFIVDTGQGMEHAREQVAAIIELVTSGQWRRKEKGK